MKDKEFRFRYRKEKGKCFVDCIANLYGIPRDKVIDVYKIGSGRESKFIEWSIKEYLIKPIPITRGLEHIMPLSRHIRVGKSPDNIYSNDTHACIYFRNNCIYDPNDIPPVVKKDGIIHGTAEYVFVFEGLIFDQNPFELFSHT